MPYTKPTLSTIVATVKSNMLAKFPSLDPSLPNGMWVAISTVIGGAVNGAYDFIDFLLKQVFYDTATDEYLERHANNGGISRLQAVAASGDVTFTGTPGSSVPTGAELVAPSGQKYTLDTGFTLAAGSEDHAVTGSDAGADSNQIATAELTLAQSHAGIDPTVTVAAGGLTGARDRETDDELRERLGLRVAAPAKGGSAADYDIWAREATAVTRTWPRNWENGPGLGDTVLKGEALLYFAMDKTYSDGIPAGGDITDVQDYIDVVKPMGCEFTAGTLTAQTVPFNITIQPDTPTLRTSVETALEDAVREFGIPGGEIELSKFQEAMAGVNGLTDWTINSPTGSVTAAAQKLHTMGTVTWT